MAQIAATELETISLDRPAPGVVVASLDRPDRLNAMSLRMFKELAALPEIVAEIDGLRVLVLAGAGRSFCAGFDLDEIEEITKFGIREFLSFQEEATGGLAAIRGLPVPVIAAVQGAAVGGGMAIALAADIRLGADDVRFSAGFIKVGLSAGDLGTSWHLQRLIGPGRTAELCFTGRFVDAEEAERIGLVNRVVPADRLLEEAVGLAGEIVANSPGGVQLSKRALQANLEIGSFAAALELENRGQALLSRGEDMPEALAAFKERREPRFTGR